MLAVVTQPDRPKGRGQRLMPPPVKELAVRHAIPVYQPVKVRDPEVVEIGRRKAVPIWDRWWYLGALAVALSAEWILRRRWGYW